MLKVLQFLVNRTYLLQHSLFHSVLCNALHWAIQTHTHTHSASLYAYMQMDAGICALAAPCICVYESICLCLNEWFVDWGSLADCLAPFFFYSPKSFLFKCTHLYCMQHLRQNDARLSISHAHFSIVRSFARSFYLYLPLQIHSALNSMMVLYLSNKQQTRYAHILKMLYTFEAMHHVAIVNLFIRFQQHATSAFKQLNVDLIFLQLYLTLPSLLMARLPSILQFISFFSLLLFWFGCCCFCF